MKWLIELNLFFWTFSRWLKELKSFCSMTPRVQLFLCSNMTQRIEPFFLQVDSKNCVFFECQRIEPFFFEYDSKNWTLCFSQNVSKNWIFFKKMLKELNLSFIWTTFYMTQWIELFSIWLEELSLFKYDSKSWTFFFLNMTQKLEPSFEYDSKKWAFLNMTQRSELFWTLLRESNPFFKTTQRIEPFSKSDSKNWPFLKMTQIIETFSKYDAKNWNFFLWIWLKELNFFFWYDSKKWNLKKDSKSWTFFF